MSYPGEFPEQELFVTWIAIRRNSQNAANRTMAGLVETTLDVYEEHEVWAAVGSAGRLVQAIMGRYGIISSLNDRLILDHLSGNEISW